MNKVLIAFNALLAAAVVYLFVRKPSSPEPEKKKEVKTEKTDEAPTNKVFSANKEDGQLRVAFIDSDTLSSQYQLFKDAANELNVMSEKIAGELKAMENAIIAKSQALEKDFQFKPKSEQEQAMRTMQQMEMNYEKKKNEKMAQLDKLRNDNLIKGEDALKKFLEHYCEVHKIDYVLRDGMVGSIFYGNKVFDITDDVAKGLNAEYKK